MAVTMGKDLRKAQKQLGDSEIIKTILERKETDLLAILYDRYATQVYEKCLRLTGDHSTAQDLMHDIVIKVFVNLSKFRGKSNFSCWVNSITYNHCMDYLKKKKQLLQFEEFDPTYSTSITTEDADPENQILYDLRLSRLEDSMNKLKQEDRQLLHFRFRDKMPIKVIAQYLKISESAVKMRLRRGLDRLSKELAYEVV